MRVNGEVWHEARASTMPAFSVLQHDETELGKNVMRSNTDLLH
jgi:hypothetical protein